MASRHFTDKELSCHCGCGYKITDPGLLDKIDRMRDIVGVPLIINSPARCPEYNRLIGGASNSAHVRAEAIDFKCISGRLRFKLVKAAYDVGFRRIEWGTKTWIHVDIGKEQDGYPQDKLFNPYGGDP